jgi:hypothetical protein
VLFTQDFIQCILVASWCNYFASFKFIQKCTVSIILMLVKKLKSPCMLAGKGKGNTTASSKGGAVTVPPESTKRADVVEGENGEAAGGNNAPRFEPSWIR